MPRTSSAYSTAERGGGAPVELYTFQRGSKVWRYTSADTTQTVSGIAFTPAWIKRAAIEQKNDTAGVQFSVTIGLETPFGQDLIAGSDQPVAVTVQRGQSAGTPVMPVLSGQMVSVKFSDDEAELTVATIERLLKTLVPRTLIQRTCPWALYSPDCGVNAATYAYATTVSAISGQTVTVDALSDTTADFYSNGVLVLATGERLFIAKHNSPKDLVLWGAIPSTLSVSDAVTAYPGCDKNRSTCISKFNNLDNFGGFPDLPAKDPKLVKLEKTFTKGSI
jgi:uncharacterized phage protein (TIGR02218 family)